MQDKLHEQLAYLGLDYLAGAWKEVMSSANNKKKSYHRFLTEIVEREFLQRQEKRRVSRLNAASIPEMFIMETFPFPKQPKLKKRKVMEVYDSMSYLNGAQWLYMVGPTGCGKSGLGTSFLVNAINKGYRGKFISFSMLMEQLYKAKADLSVEKIMKRFAALDCLLIDELGYHQMNKEQASLFFDLIKLRHKKKCTIFTTQLGFKQWQSFFTDGHLRNASIDRITENCAVFGMQECITLRPKHVVYMTDCKELDN